MRSLPEPEGSSNCAFCAASFCAISGLSSVRSSMVSGTTVTMMAMRKAAYSSSTGLRATAPCGPASRTSLPQMWKLRLPTFSLGSRRTSTVQACRPVSIGLPSSVPAFNAGSRARPKRLAPVICSGVRPGGGIPHSASVLPVSIQRGVVMKVAKLGPGSVSTMWSQCRAPACESQPFMRSCASTHILRQLMSVTTGVLRSSARPSADCTKAAIGGHGARNQTV